MRGGIPDARSVIVRRGDDASTVGRECSVGHYLSMASEYDELLPRTGVPDASRVVVCGRDHLLSVR